MEYSQRELILSQIVASITLCNVNTLGQVIIRPFTPIDKYIANQLYSKALREAGFQDVMTDKEVLNMLLDLDLWSPEEEGELNDIPEKILGLKVALYESYYNTKQCDMVRKSLADMKKRHDVLYHKRHSHDHLTCSTAAAMKKLTYLVGASTYYQDGTRVWPSENIIAEQAPMSILEKLVCLYNESRPTESQLRELSHTEPWLSTWHASKSGTLFSHPAVECTDDQKILIAWSKFYENIGEHPECPAEDILSDDDMLDGWLELEKRKRRAEKKQQDAENRFGGGKIGEASEIFVVVKDREDAKRINELNSIEAQAIKRRRQQALEAKGILPNHQMPDKHLEIMNQAREQFKAKFNKD